MNTTTSRQVNIIPLSPALKVKQHRWGWFCWIHLVLVISLLCGGRAVAEENDADWVLSAGIKSGPLFLQSAL